MTNTHYEKDTKALWQARKQARANLDRNRTNATIAQKIKVSEKLNSDMAFLKSGRIV